MTLRAYIIIMAATTAVCWVAFSFIIWIVDPKITNWVGFILFYSSLFVSLVGTFSILGFMMRFMVLKKELVFRSVKEAFRQSFLLSLLIISCLYLLSRGLFNWYNVAILSVALSVMELLLISYKNK